MAWRERVYLCVVVRFSQGKTLLFSRSSGLFFFRREDGDKYFSFFLIKKGKINIPNTYLLICQTPTH